jgi:hypothetical protein
LKEVLVTDRKDKGARHDGETEDGDDRSSEAHAGGWLDGTHCDAVYWIDLAALVDPREVPAIVGSGEPGPQFAEKPTTDAEDGPDGSPSGRRLRWELSDSQSDWELTFRIRQSLGQDPRPEDKP